MALSHLLACLDELFELDPGTISPTDVLQEIDGWSSLTFMGLIAMVDDEFGVTLLPTTVLDSRTIGDLWIAIQILRVSAAAA